MITLKVKSSDEHNIVDIKDTAIYQHSSEPDPDCGHIKCKNHEGKNCCLFCKECEEVVYLIWMDSSHNWHINGIWPSWRPAIIPFKEW
jgi:hypothetical protein